MVSSRLSTRSEDRPRGPLSILLTPRAAFLGLRGKPRAVVLVLAVSLLAALPGVAFVTTVDLGAYLDKQMRASGQKVEEMPEEAQRALKEQAPKVMRVVIPVGAAGKRAGWILLMGVLGFAFLRGGFPALRFSQAAAAVALATTPLVLGDVLKAALFWSQDAARLDVMNPILSNPAAWFGLSVEKSPLGAVLSHADLFELWSLALTAMGLNVVAGAKSKIPWILVGVTFAALVVMDVVGAAAVAAKIGA